MLKLLPARCGHLRVRRLSVAHDRLHRQEQFHQLFSR